ncbi:protein CASPARIAN STRIP INTEGRITY FACTOR 1-like [Coffea arabica]|uniref:Protein CASPARIAN STRIP INTEGRITY FACTOR 1-like n=1 Tax=Coffea arabica TaxID=13443 RepID=A0A6P6WC72_COFAR|nr:protein CASPARIAN STRIP INTEGRITY FACTOR 1-like [Coffea arabica]
MGLMLLLKNIGLLFLLVSASLLSASSAGRHSRFASNSKKVAGAGGREEVQKEHLSHEEVMEVHERLLKVNTKDYGRYDPSPALGKPPFKLIPN